MFRFVGLVPKPVIRLNPTAGGVDVGGGVGGVEVHAANNVAAISGDNAATTAVRKERFMREALSLFADGDVGGSAALVALGGQDHVVVGAQPHAQARPGIEVVSGSDGAAGALRLTDAPVLA